MKTLGAITTALLLVLLTASVPQLRAQEREEERNGAKSIPQQDERRPQADRDNRAGQQTRANKPTEQRSEPDRPRSDQEPTAQPQTARPQHEQKPETERNNEQRPQTEHTQQRPVQAQRGKRIPEDRFRANFGSQHTFRVQRTQVVNVSQPVIVASGYSFELLDPWPAEWAFDDPCYVDFVDDQYFLFDTFHPGFRIALIVVNVD